MNASGTNIVLITFFFAFVLQSFYGVAVQESVSSLVAAPLFVLGFVATNLFSLPGILVLVVAFYSAKWLFASLGLGNILSFVAILFLLILIL